MRSLSWLRNLRQRLGTKGQRRTPIRKKRTSTLLALEILEDRLTPSATPGWDFTSAGNGTISGYTLGSVDVVIRGS